jgi:hypothetical protein
MEQHHVQGGEQLGARSVSLGSPEHAEEVGAIAVSTLAEVEHSAGVSVPRHEEVNAPPAITVRRLAVEYEPLARAPLPLTTRHEQPSNHQLALPLEWLVRPHPYDDEGRVSTSDMQATGLLLRAIVEVLDGRRPLVQLRDRLEKRVFAALQTRTRAIQPTTDALQLRSMHGYQTAGGAIEACATLQQGEHCRALAARLNGRKSGWLCTALQIL